MSDFDYAYGDSIAVGLNSEIDSTINVNPQTSSVNGQVIAQQGIDPTAVLNNIKNIVNTFDIRGLNIALSSGTSNNPSKTGVISAQIDALKQAGATVVLIGVSNTFPEPGFSGPDLNAKLQAIAAQAGIKFSGGFKANTHDNVHPESYSALYEHAVTELA